MAVSISIIEDHSEFRQSLEYLIASFSDYHLASSAGSVEEFMDENKAGNVLLLDINLPGMSGIEAIPLLKGKFPELKIIMLTILDDDQHIMEAIKRGADGYILKKTPPQRILDAVQQVQDGGAALTPMIARQVLAFFKAPLKKNNPEEELTPREKEILGLITEGLSTEGIAAKLFISNQTVRNHIKNIYGKLQVHSRAQAVARALNEKLI